MLNMTTAKNNLFDACLIKLGYNKKWSEDEQGRRWIKTHCPCPNHEDRNPSFVMTEKEDGGILVHCFAGCHYTTIFNALGIRNYESGYESYENPIKPMKKPLPKVKQTKLVSYTLQEFGQEKGFDLHPYGFISAQEIEQRRYKGVDAIYIPYKLEDGSIANRDRFRVKEMNKETGEIKTTYRWFGTGEIVPYGLDRLESARKEGYLFLVEGETDCLTLWLYGFQALGLPGAKNTNCLKAEYVTGISTVYVMNEKDEAGNIFVKDIAAKLQQFGWQGQLYEVKMPDGIKDPNELHVKLNNFDQFIQEMNRIKEYAESIEIEEKTNVVSLPTGFEPMPLPEKRSAFAFPTQVFPPKLRTIIEGVAKGLQVQPDFIGGYVLATAGLAIGNTRLIETKQGWKQKPNLWMCLVAPPGSAKSPSLRFAFSPVVERQKKAEITYEKEYEEYKRELFNFEQEKKEAKDYDELSNEPQPPILTKYYCSDATIEAQMKIMKENPRGIGLYLDELSGWIRGMGQYKGGKGNDKQLNMSAWAGEALTRDRLKEGTQSIYNSFLSVLGNLPPAQLQELSGEIKDGFIERFLFVYPDRKKPVFTWDGIDPKLTEAYAELLDKIFALSAPVDETGTMQNQIVRLSEEAKPLYADWENALYDEMYSEDFDTRLELPWSKMGIQMCRIALIMHVLRWIEGETPNEFEIDATTLLCAMELINYFKEHYKKVIDQLHETEEDSKVYEIVEWIKKKGVNGVVTKRQLQQSKKCGSKGSDVDEMLEKLQDYGYGVVEKRKPPGGKGGRPSICFVLHNYSK